MTARANSRGCRWALCVLHSQQQRGEAHRETEAATPGAPAMVISLPSAAAGEPASCHRVGSRAGGTCTGVMRPVAWLPYALPYTLLLTPATDKSTLMGKDCRSIVPPVTRFRRWPAAWLPFALLVTPAIRHSSEP